jgi:hypothetical protein
LLPPRQTAGRPQLPIMCLPPDVRILGQVGFEDQFPDMAIGSLANLAARLCDAAQTGANLEPAGFERGC